MIHADTDAWLAFEQAEASLGPEKAALLSYRMPPVSARPAGTPRDIRDPRAEIAPAPLDKGDGFRLLEPIGRGGMGAVYKAVQLAFGREVAIKRALSDDSEIVRQFISEARITSLLDHANIVPVHLMRTAPDGPPDIVMKLVRGVPWSELLHGAGAGAVDLEAHLRILLSVCDAISYAHKTGILHRDIKPDNVMTDELNQVYVVDWGIAAGLDARQCDARGMAFVGDARAPVGTPGYMAPELARGDGPSQGPPTDVYLLGGCLHEILTRRRRHEGATVRAVLDNAVASAPFVYDPSIEWELAEICNRATAALPRDRYPDVASFRGAVEGYLKHREAHSIARKGLALVADLRGAIARFNALRAKQPEAAPAVASVQEKEDELAREIHVRFSEAQFALQTALGIWDGLRDAREGLGEAKRLMLQHAIVTEDVRLAAQLAEDAEQRAQAAALRARLSARAAELAALRQAARRLDWAAVSKPLGNVYILGGIIGSAVMPATQALLASGLSHTETLLANAAVWFCVALVIGALALVSLRQVRVPDSLISPRLLGTWGAISFSCLCVGAFNELRSGKLEQDTCYCALLIGVGFVSMALQTRRWLLIPAAAFFAGAVVSAVFPAVSFGLFSALWLFGIGGVGVALRLGATLDSTPLEGAVAARPG